MATKKAAPKKAADAIEAKRSYFRQADFPLFTLQECQRIAGALIDNFGGRDGSPPDVALAIGNSPTSSTWRDMAGAAIAYGLTDGGPQAAVIKLLPLGRKLAAPEAEGEDVLARREAILKPRIAMEFFEKYRRAKFPGDVIAVNVLRSLGIPPDRTEKALEILKANGRYAGIIRETPTGPFVNLDSPAIPGPTTTAALTEDDPPSFAEVAPAETPRALPSSQQQPTTVATVDPKSTASSLPTASNALW